MGANDEERAVNKSDKCTMRGTHLCLLEPCPKAIETKSHHSRKQPDSRHACCFLHYVTELWVLGSLYWNVFRLRKPGGELWKSHYGGCFMCTEVCLCDLYAV